MLETQQDYEPEVTLAAFRSPREAAAAERALQTAGVAYERAELPAGTYQLADRRLRRHTRAVVRAAIVGAVVGAIIGAVLAVVLVGPQSNVITWLAVTGAGGGAIIGGLVGVQRSGRYDEDVARTIDVGERPPATLIITQLSQADRGHGQVRQLLRSVGTVDFLDVRVYEARVRDAEPGPVTNTTPPR